MPHEVNNTLMKNKDSPPLRLKYFFKIGNNSKHLASIFSFSVRSNSNLQKEDIVCTPRRVLIILPYAVFSVFRIFILIEPNV